MSNLQDRRTFGNSLMNPLYTSASQMKSLISECWMGERKKTNYNIGTMVNTSSIDDMMSKESGRPAKTLCISGFIGAKTLMNRPIVKFGIDFYSITDDLNMQRGILESVKSMPSCFGRQPDGPAKVEGKTYAEVCASTNANNNGFPLKGKIVEAVKEQKIENFININEDGMKDVKMSSPSTQENELPVRVQLEKEDDMSSACISGDKEPVSSKENENSRMRSDSECSSLSCISFLSEETDSDDTLSEAPLKNPILAYILGGDSDSDCDSEDSMFSEDEFTDSEDENDSIPDFTIPVGGLIICQAKGNFSSPCILGRSDSSPRQKPEESFCNENDVQSSSAKCWTINHSNNYDEVDSVKLNYDNKPSGLIDDNAVIDYSDYEEILQCVAEANKRWTAIYGIQDQKIDLPSDRTDFCQKRKTVHFPDSPESLVSGTRLIPADEERKGIWETYATNRFRFRRRINNLEEILNPVLDKEHRAKVLKSRADYSCLSSP